MVNVEENQYIYNFPRPMITVDVAIFSKDLHWVLLIKRKNDPFKDNYAMAGGYLNMDETIETAAKRELKEETGLDIPVLKFNKYYDGIERDPRGRTITFCFYAMIDKKLNKNIKAKDDAISVDWLKIEDIMNLNIAFDHKTCIMDAYKKALGDKQCRL